ncbi:MAG: DUF4153 domain-containing protein [Butyrivibrio sp.]|nr:DUF4153 domain-containing protein [Butyrivibrio sp.]
MLVISKLKQSFEDAIKEHAFSVILFLAAIIVLAINEDGDLSKAFDLTTYLLFGLSGGALLCESIRLVCNKDKGFTIPLYSVIMALSFLVAFQFGLITLYAPVKRFFGDRHELFENLSRDLVICSIVTALCLTLFFFYKRSGECFETYTAKAFCGLMKAQLVYGIIAVGVALIIWAFNVLIFDTSRFDVLERVEILLIGLVEYPCVLVGLGKTGEEIGKFAKAILRYVFTALLAVSFVIIYLYIAKILITWKFPKNQVFSILAALFVCGFFIWTMAQGVGEGKMEKAFRILPFFFIPFIVLQIMCLYMRVSAYGYTASRYMGLALIIFEVIYYAFYIPVFIGKKDMMYVSLFIVCAASFIVLLMPGTNMYSVVTASQKKRIESCFSQGADAVLRDKKAAYEAYWTIKESGGFAGRHYLDKKLLKEQKEEIESYKALGGNDFSEDFYISAFNDDVKFDVSGFDTMYVVDNSFYRSEAPSGAVDVKRLKVTDKSGKELGYVDLEKIINKLIELDELGYEDSSEKDNAIKGEIPLSSGGVLYISYFSVSGNRNAEAEYDDIEITGYVLK